MLTCERINGVAIVKLNRPEVRNALSTELRRNLRTSMAELDADDNVHVIILTGADPAFCAGVDLRELDGDDVDHDPVGPESSPFDALTTPLVGAINGATYTGGLEIALMCHFLIASERATFADTHARIGLLPGWGMSVLLSEAIGIRRAREMSFSSVPIDAQTAFAWGLVNRVVAHDELLAAATELGLAICANDHEAVQRHVRLYYDQGAVHNADAWRLEREAWTGVDGFHRPDQSPHD